MKRVLLSLSLLFTTLSVFADENILQSIEIEPVKDTYNIVLVSDKAVNVKKTVQASNQITLSMKDIRASKTLNTIYNNVSNVDTVMVEPAGNGIKIFFQADNAAASTVTFDSLIPASALANKTTKNLKLNNPIESYAPIYTETFEDVKTSSMFDKLKAKSMVSIKDTINSDSVPSTGNKLMTFGLIGVLLFSAIKLLRRKEPEMKIGLSQSLTSREIDMHKNNLHIQPQYVQPEKSFSTVNYGINAYQRENRNPYETAPMQFHNPRMNEYAQPVNQVQQPVSTVSKNINTSTLTLPQAQVKKMTTPVNSAPVNQSNPNIDNLKFLESMTAIYEKSGRHDLARGLKASLSKNNIK